MTRKKGYGFRREYPHKYARWMTEQGLRAGDVAVHVGIGRPGLLGILSGRCVGGHQTLLKMSELSGGIFSVEDLIREGLALVRHQKAARQAQQ